MNCNCFDEILAKIEPQIKPKDEVLDFKLDWRDAVLRFDGGFGVGLYVRAEYFKIKKNGERFVNKTKDDRFVALSFCPFCGKSLKKGETKDV